MFSSRNDGKRITYEPKVLIVVENMSYTFDTRVQKVAKTLAGSGYRVQVICPRYPGDSSTRIEGNISIIFYPLPPLPNGFIGHILEYAYSFAAIALLVFTAWISRGFDILHVCNPPDIFFPLGAFFRLVGCKFVFDLHDLCPELWQVRYGWPPSIFKLLLVSEAATARVANHVLLTSRIQRERICCRVGIKADRVSLVYNGPDLEHFPPLRTDSHPDHTMLVGYVGDMNPQDGIENLLLAAHHIRYSLGRQNVRFLCIGDGSAYKQLWRLSEQLGLTGVVEFSGRLLPKEAMKRLAACTICIQPDPKNSFTDSCAMVKSLEYMALSKPFVAFDLEETRNVCGDAALYVRSASYRDIAAEIIRLVDDPELCRILGKSGRSRIQQKFSWPHSGKCLLHAYQGLLDDFRTARHKPDPTVPEAASPRTRVRGLPHAKILWLLSRLRAMTTSEVLTRTYRAIRKLNWRRRTWNIPPVDIRVQDAWAMPELSADTQKERALLLSEADGYIAGCYKLLNVSYKQKTPDWHLDVETGTRSPMTFALDINYRDRKITGNIKNTWELNRHRHITVLAAAYALTRDERYACEVERQLRSWVESNPFLRGVNWHSALELGLRLIAWIWAERLLRGCGAHDRLFGPKGRLWPVIYQHQWLIAKLKSVGSSANNHLVGELSGLFMASTVWPYYPESKRWQNESSVHLEREITLQTYRTGLNREQAFSYHRFSLELFLLAALEAERAKIPFSPAYKRTLKCMLEAIPGLTDIGGNLPTYGDEDGGTALQLQPREASPMGWLYRLGRGLPGACVPLPPENSGLLAAVLIDPGTKAASIDFIPPFQLKTFPDAGLYVLTVDRGKSSEIFCLADAGALGYLSIAAHGHADALSFTLSVGGQPVIVDPGTYSYFGESHWRRYFRSTRAHNTITIDGLDQSEPGGPFLWVRKAHCKMLRWIPESTGAELVAEHDGYKRLQEGVIHRRRLALTKDHLEIVDHIIGGGVHELEWRLHFGPNCDVRLENNHCNIHWAGGAADIALSDLMQWRLESGTRNAGWYSPSYNLKIATTTLVGRKQTACPQVIVNNVRFYR